MIDLFTDISEYCRLVVPEEHKLPIAVVGAGGIVDGQHLPAYKLAGLEVVGITDVDLDRAREVADRHGIPKVYARNWLKSSTRMPSRGRGVLTRHPTSKRG